MCFLLNSETRCFTGMCSCCRDFLKVCGEGICFSGAETESLHRTLKEKLEGSLMSFINENPASTNDGLQPYPFGLMTYKPLLIINFIY